MVNTRSEIRAITRRHKRARDTYEAVRAAPIMQLPADIRDMIYAALAPIDRVKVDCSDSLTAVFNPYRTYYLSLKNEGVNHIMVAIYIDLGLLPALCNNPQFAKEYAAIKCAVPRPILAMKPDVRCIYCRRAPHTITIDNHISFWTSLFIELTDEYIFAVKFALQRLRYNIIPIKCTSIKYNVYGKYRLLLGLIIFFAEELPNTDQIKRNHVAEQYLSIFEEYYVNNPIIPLNKVIMFHYNNEINNSAMVMWFSGKTKVINYSILCRLFKHFVPHITQIYHMQIEIYDQRIVDMVYNTKNILRLIKRDMFYGCDKTYLEFKIRTANPAILQHSSIIQFLNSR